MVRAGDGWRSTIQDHQLLTFLIVGFGWTWTVWGVGLQLGYGGTRWLQAVGASGPLIAAAVVTRAAGYDLRSWAAQVVPHRDLGLQWYGLAVVVPFALTQTGVVIGWVLGVPISIVPFLELAFDFVVTLLVAGALEEFGWRGFLQPRLQERHSALAAAVAIGVVWAVWHAPLALGGTGAGYESGELAGLLVGLPIFSIVMAWLYNSTRGGLLFVMVFHAVINTTPVLEAAENTTAMGLAELAVLVGLPVGIVLYYGSSSLAAARPDPPIPGKE